MKQNEQIASSGKPVFEGTVQELAGRIEIGGEVLSQQEVQFLTRIGRVAGFATEIGFAEGTGTRGGKRAKIWSIKPGFRVSLSSAAQKAPAKRASKAAQPAVDMSGIDTNSQEFHDAVAAAVAQLKKGQPIAASAPVKQTRQRKGKNTEAPATTEAATVKRSPGRPRKNATTEAAPAK